MDSATDLRKKEEAKNTATIKDATGLLFIGYMGNIGFRALGV